MKTVLRLIVIDDKTKEKYKTPGHSDKPNDDDYHGEIKPIIKADLPRKLKGKFGHNVDIAISEGMIVIVSQIFGEDGQRTNKRIRTELKADDYFEKVSKLMLFTILNELELEDYDSVVIKVNRENKDCITYIVELRVVN